MLSKLHKTLIVSFLLIAILVTGCAPSAGTEAPATGGEGGEVKLILAGYTTPREAYTEIIPLFQAHWEEQTGQTVTFEESGIYPYLCTVHPWMTGTIEVT